LAFNQEVVRQKPGEVQKIVNAIFKAIHFAGDHPKEAIAIMAPYFQVDPAKYEKILQGVNFTGLKRNREYFGTPGKPGPIIQVASRASQIWEQAGVIARPVNPEDIITTDFVIRGDR
jgi:NitT/TauT family transport system substrate-binding protein